MGASPELRKACSGLRKADMLGATHTLLVLTSQRLARIDFVGRGRRLRIEQIHICPAAPTGSLATNLVQAWQAIDPSTPWQSKRLRPVWVVSTDCFTDVVQLPLDTALLLNPQELEQALAIEAESLSGISAFAAQQYCWKLVDIASNWAEHAWWITQVADAELATMRTVLERLGGSFQGATHPAMVQMLASDSPVDRQQAASAIETWQAGKSAAHDETAFQSALEQLGQAFLVAQHQNTLKRCMLADDSHPSNDHRLARLQTLVAIAAVLMCGGHYWQQSRHLINLQHQAKEQSLLAGQERLIQQELHACDNRIKTLRQQIADQTARRQQLEQSRLVTTTSLPDGAYWSELLECLARQSNDQWWLESLESDQQCLTLHGWATTSEAALALASQLSRALATYDCQVQLPAFIDQSGILRFELKVTLPGGNSTTLSSTMLKALPSGGKDKNGRSTA